MTSQKKHVNMNPNLAHSILSSPKTKKYFPVNPFSIDSLYERGFDIKGSVGDMLFSEKRMGSIQMIIDVYSVITQRPDFVYQTFDNKTLRQLNQRRHILVHQRGLVDKAYLDNTRDGGVIGKHVTITGTNIEDYINIILGTSKKVIEMLGDKQQSS